MRTIANVLLEKSLNTLLKKLTPQDLAKYEAWKLDQSHDLELDDKMLELEIDNHVVAIEEVKEMEKDTDQYYQLQAHIKKIQKLANLWDT